MPKERVASTRSIHEYRISLRGIEPPIWRRIAVPASYSFWDLHVAIQDAMGWLDYHTHVFRIRTPEPVLIGIPDDDPLFPDAPRRLACPDVAVTRYFQRPGDVAEYEYGLGDGWVHEVCLEAIVEPTARTKYPVCLGGARACPPEDCGGIEGYRSLQASIADTPRSQPAGRIERKDGRFDPEAFHPRKVRFDNPQKRWKTVFEEA